MQADDIIYILLLSVSVSKKWHVIGKPTESVCLCHQMSTQQHNHGWVDTSGCRQEGSSNVRWCDVTFCE